MNTIVFIPHPNPLLKGEGTGTANFCGILPFSSRRRGWGMRC